MKHLTPVVVVCLALGGCASTDDEPHAEGPVEAPIRQAADAEPPMDPDVEDAEEIEEHPDLVALREAVDGDPESAAAHRRLGVALRRTGQTPEAFRHLERAVELAPDDIDVRMSLGIAYATEHRLTEAEAAYRHILELEPQHAKALHNLGNVAMRRGDEDEAIELYRLATAADPDYLTAYLKLADLLKYHGRLDEAYPVYKKILTMTPGSPRDQVAMVESMYGMGSISLARHEYETAEQQLATVVRIMPHHRSAHWARAQALIQLGRQEEAQQELQLHVGTLVDPGGGS